MCSVIFLGCKEFNVMTLLELRDISATYLCCSINQLFCQIHVAHMVATDFSNNLNLLALIHARALHALNKARYVKRISSMSKRSEEHTSELQSLMSISYAVFCLKKIKITSYTLQCIRHIFTPYYQ